MRKALVLLAIGATALLSAPGARAQDANAAPKELNVVATIPPVHSLVAAVMGETGSPDLLIRGGDSPHGFQMKPSHMRAMQDADILFYVDENFESFLINAFGSLPDSVTRVPLADTQGIMLLDARTGGVWQDDEHGDHGHESHEHPRDGQAIDYHIWLDPDNAAKMTMSIAAALSEADPERAETFEKNAADMVERIYVTDINVKGRLSGLQERPFVVFHDAWQYFEKRYDLAGTGSITVDPHEPPSVARVQDIRSAIAERNAVCVFTEPQFSDRLIGTILEGSGARTATIDPLGYNLEEGGSLYVTLIETIAENFANCLSHRK